MKLPIDGVCEPETTQYEKTSNSVVIPMNLPGRQKYIVVSDVEPLDGSPKCVDIRKFYMGDDGDIHPSSKGLHIRHDVLSDAARALINHMESDARCALITKLKENSFER